MEIEAVIGLEIHTQLSTNTKMFCRCKNESFNSRPNTNICPVCMGFPGQLPVLNKEALNKAMKMALALKCDIRNLNKMDRKNYFYPDNPRGFQISQYDEPLSENGFFDLEIENNGEVFVKKIRINRIHIEDDAGKLTHLADSTLVDFNRAGTPLIEIVTEPDLSNSEEASLFAKEIQKIVRFVGAGEADMDKGMLRFDASISVRKKGESKLNHRAEIKNLNSFRALETALNFEIKRQSEMFEKGELIEGDITLGFNDETQSTYFLRDKEESLDYRYFPEPDLPVLNISREEINKLSEQIPVLPMEKKKIYMTEFSMREDDARIISSNPKYSDFFDEVLALTKDPKASVSFFNTVLMKYLNENMIDIGLQKVTPTLLAELIGLVNQNVISNNQAKNDIFPEMFETGKSSSKIVEEKGLGQISDIGVIEDLCKKIVNENPDSVEAIKNGKDRIIGFLIGLVMKESKGSANPAMVDEIIRKLIKL